MWELGKNRYPSKQYVEWFHEGEWVGMPLVPQSLVTEQPMSPFSPAIQRGDDSRVLDQRLNVSVYSNFTGGQGQRVLEKGSESQTYYRGTLDTRNDGYLVLPPYAQLQKDTAVSFTAPIRVTGSIVPSNLQKTLIMWGPRQNGAVHINLTTNTQTNLFAGFYVREITNFRGSVFASLVSTSTGNPKLQVSTDGGVTWADIAASLNKYVCLTLHDNRLFSYDITGPNLVTSSDGTTWTVVGMPLYLAAGEVPWQLDTWTTPDGREETVYFLTNYMLYILEEEPGAWHDFYNFRQVIDLDYPRMHLWRRNNIIYVTNYDNLDVEEILVLSLNGATSDEVGPQKLGGLPQDVTVGFSNLQGNVHDLYAFGVGGVLPDGTTSRGQIMSMQEMGGWHPIMDGNKIDSGNSVLVGGGYFYQTVYGVLANGKVYWAPAKDRRVKHPSPVISQYDTQAHEIESVTDKMGLPHVWKIGAYFLVDAEMPDGSHGIPTGSTVCLWYRTDGGSWIALPCAGSTESQPIGLLLMQSLLPNNITWPYLIKLPLGGEQLGVPFKELQWKLRMQRTSISSSPAIREVSLYYSLWLEQFYSYSFNVDLRSERFEKFPEQSFGKYDRDQLINFLYEISNHRGYMKFRFSLGIPNVPETTVESTDMLMGSRLEPLTGGGIFQVSIRNLTAATLV